MNKLILVTIIVLLLAFSFYFFGIIKPKCNTDQCFNENLQKCSPVKYTRLQNNNLYKYTVSRSLGSKCKLTVENKKMAIGTDFDIKNLLEDKSMKCKIPKSKLSEIELGNMKDLLSYCTGPLKEGMYELLLKRMYSLVVSQMADIVKEAEKTLERI